MENNEIKSIFFGTPKISVYFLEKLKNLGFNFDLILTNNDKKIGRKKILTSSPVKTWALENNTEILEIEKIDQNLINKLKKTEWDFFFVLAYGKILPEELLNIPRLGTFNLHPSLLPKYRGPSPIISAILDDQKNTGISIMKLDKEMDHGPILLQKEIKILEWKKNNQMEKLFAQCGAEEFFNILNNSFLEEAFFTEQNHQEATFCKKYQKEDMQMEFPFSEKNARKNFLKYSAFSKPFYFNQDKKRTIVTKAKWEKDNFVIEKIIIEGKKERNF